MRGNVRATVWGKAGYLAALAVFLAGFGLLAYMASHRNLSDCPSGGSCALVRGILGDTSYSWAKNPNVRPEDPTPSPRYLASVAYDAAHDDFVLFGGETRAGTSDETWILRRALAQYSVKSFRWRQARPAHTPPRRRGAAMAWDPQSRMVLMYGGLIPNTTEGREGSDTWGWDGSDWRELTETSDGPGARDGPSMVTAGDHVLLFGGHEANVKYYADAWTWSGTRWARVDSGPAPPGRGNAAVVWDPTLSAMFVFGGYGLRADAGPGNLGVPLADAWVLKGGAWSELPTGPPALVLPVARWVPGGQIEVSGVKCPGDVDDLWAWSGAAWSELGSGGRPRWGAATAEDAEHYRLVFGGSSETSC